MMKFADDDLLELGGDSGSLRVDASLSEQFLQIVGLVFSLACFDAHGGSSLHLPYVRLRTVAFQLVEAAKELGKGLYIRRTCVSIPERLNGLRVAFQRFPIDAYRSFIGQSSGSPS